LKFILINCYYNKLFTLQNANLIIYKTRIICFQIVAKHVLFFYFYVNLMKLFLFKYDVLIVPLVLVDSPIRRAFESCGERNREKRKNMRSLQLFTQKNFHVYMIVSCLFVCYSSVFVT